MADLFVHIGAPKTGTTAIQSFLARHKAALEAKGVLYPEAGRLGVGHNQIGGLIYRERTRKLKLANPAHALAEALAGIAAEIDASQPHSVILSSEYLWGGLAPARIRRLLAPFSKYRLHLIAYLRRQDHLAQSLYTQAVKGGAIRSFEQWLEAEADEPRTGLHFDQVMSSWRDSGFDIDIRVRVYEPGQIASDVRRDFLDIVCPEAGIEVATGQRGINTSPDHATIEIVRRVNATVKDRSLAAELRRKLMAAASPREAFAPLDYFSPDAARAFVARFDEGNAAIARGLLGRADGILFREPPPSGPPAATLNANAMLTRLIELLPDLLQIA